MNPALVMFGIRAAIRIANAGSEALGQYARDREVLLPHVRKIGLPAADYIRSYFLDHPDRLTPELSVHWEAFRADDAARLAVATDFLAAEVVRLQTLENPEIADRDKEEVAGLWLIGQWAEGQAPIGPCARILITIADVAIEFAGSNPSLFGIDGRAEPLIKALAAHISELIPDDADELGPRSELGARLAGIFLRGGLAALSEQPQAILEEKHLQLLARNTLPHLVAALPPNLAELTKARVVETLLGPVASAAIATMAQDPKAFFGLGETDDDPIGALTRTFLLKVAEIGLDDTFTRTGAIELYRSALRLVAARPQLFIGRPEGDTDRFVTALLADVAAAAAEFTPPFEKSSVVVLATTTLDTVGRNIDLLVGPKDDPWKNVLGQALLPVLGALKQTIETSDTGALKRLVGSDQLTEFVRIVLSQAAKTPGMIAGADNPELARLVSVVAAAMAKDENLLLSDNDWLEILAIVAEEAAANPARLIGVKIDGQIADVAEPLIQGLLKVAGAEWRRLGRAQGALLFGDTLREAIAVVVRTAVGNARAAYENADEIEALAERLSATMSGAPDKFGAKEWLIVYRKLAPEVIATGKLPPLDEASLTSLLKEAMA